MVDVPLPKVVAPPVMLTEPALAVRPPPTALAPLKARVPLPLLAKPLAPASGVEMVAMFWLTAIVGTFVEPPSSVSVLPPAKAQFSEPDVSPNFNPPIEIGRAHV